MQLLVYEVHPELPLRDQLDSEYQIGDILSATTRRHGRWDVEWGAAARPAVAVRRGARVVLGDAALYLNGVEQRLASETAGQ